MEPTETSGLDAWRVGKGTRDEHYARVVANPLFGQACRTLAANMLAVTQAHKGVFTDAGRYVSAMFALQLHVTGGLTLPRLKEACAASGYLSPGRARALLLYMRYLNFIEPTTTREKVARYVPTANFVTAWSNQLHGALAGAAILEPEVHRVMDRLREPPVFDALVKVQGELWAGITSTTHSNGAMERIIIHRHAGIQMLWTMIVGDTTFPPGSAQPFAVSDSARRFGVSRVHLKRMFDEGARAGLMIVTPSTLQFTAPALAHIRFQYGIQIVHLLTAAAEVDAQLGLAEQMEPAERTPEPV